MKTLTVHPKDSSTSFLDIVYKDIPNNTIITGGITKLELRELIQEHDRVMMMGHGSPMGLFSVGQFHDKYGTNNGYIIDSTLVDVLSEKQDNVYIWCWASDFVVSHNLKGFSSGMFISEVGEAVICSYDKKIDSELQIKLKTATQGEVDESNYGFCNIMSKYVNESTPNIYDNVMKEYGLIADNNAVASYNHNRIKMYL